MERVVSKASYIPHWNRSTLMDYLLVAHPDTEVDQVLKMEKRQFAEQYQLDSVPGGRPFIRLAAFQAKESMEETLIRWIQRICSLNKGFLVALNNYSGIPAHTIYWRVQDPLPFQQLLQALKVIDVYVQSNECPPVNFNSRPYLSLASQLPEPIYEEAMMEYSGRSFHESFMVNELVLLRRNNDFEACRQVNVFGLYPPDTNNDA